MRMFSGLLLRMPRGIALFIWFDIKPAGEPLVAGDELELVAEFFKERIVGGSHERPS